jgi:hypothetical protein
MNSSNTELNSHRLCTRRRRYPRSKLLAASAVALSVSSVEAFQNGLPLHSRHQSVNECRPATAQWVVTDPEQLLRMDRADRRISNMYALEDMYILSTGHDGLAGDLVEGAAKRLQALSTVEKNEPSTRKKGTNSRLVLKNNSEGNVTNGRTPQFKQLSSAAAFRTRKPLSAASLTRTPPKARGAAPETMERMEAKKNRSSTMPGFIERGLTGRQQAFREAVSMVEQRTGKKFKDTSQAKKDRRRLNGQAMYKTSASVPDSMLQFADDIHNEERITSSEELELGEKTQEAIRLQNLYDSLAKNLNRKPSDDEWCAAAGKINMEAISQAIEEGSEAKNKLVTSNLRMVQGVVNVYIKNGLGGQYNAGDLMQEGILVRLLCETTTLLVHSVEYSYIVHLIFLRR